MRSVLFRAIRVVYSLCALLSVVLATLVAGGFIVVGQPAGGAGYTTVSLAVGAIFLLQGGLLAALERQMSELARVVRTSCRDELDELGRRWFLLSALMLVGGTWLLAVLSALTFASALRLLGGATVLG